MRSSLRRYLLAALATLACAPVFAQLAPAGQPQLDLPRTTLTIGMHRIDTQLATTPEQRQIGLMFRKDMPQHEGMLFVFEQPAVQCFWMKNTLIPLTAAFVADDGSIVNLVDMQPLDEKGNHCSTQPVRYVLEMNQGWFKQRHLAAGSKLRGKPFAAQAAR
ncbi:MAG: DUF192 domain-containing protein [Pseudomonadota bacterium]|nr:DUF192 domain-containing protein [Pseudomonadota bacterium]